MTVLPAGHPFRKHAENLRVVLAGLTQIERLHRAEIRRSNDAGVEVLARLHMLAVGLMAEARLRKICADPDGFNDRERSLLAAQGSQFDRWRASVDFAFRRHYSVPIHVELDPAALGAIADAQRIFVLDLLDTYLAALISDRNKTAHAQWAWHLNSKERAFTGAAPATLNFRAIHARSQLIAKIGELVHVLAVSEPTFQRDFTAIAARIAVLATKVDGSDYPTYVINLRATARHP